MENNNCKSGQIKRFTAVNPVYAAIFMALYECDDNNIHDKETNVLTFDESKQHGCPWSSKVLTMRHAPRR